MLNTKKIEDVRRIKGYTQIAFAEKLDINIKTYQNLIRSGNFRVEQLILISDILGISIPNLFEGYEFDDNAIAKVQEEVSEYKTKMKDMEKEIKYLKEINELLKKQNK